MGFHGNSDGKEFEDESLILRLGISPGEGKGNPL